MFEKGHKKFIKKKRKYCNGAKKDMLPPTKYQQNFLNKMDFRTEKYHVIDFEYRQLIADLGGEDDLSAMEKTLAERLVFVNFLIRDLEVQMANSGNGSQEKYLDQWIKLNHSIQSIVAKLGVQRRKAGGSELQSYLDEKDE